MGMLSRYQKPGGFMQLLALIETCGKTKQENFLNIIEKEDARWAQAIRQKMLTLEKILSWDDNTIAEIFSRVTDITLATALHGLSPEDYERITRTFSHSQKRKIDDLKNSKNANASEISSAFVKILEEVRSMIKDGYLKLDKIAPEMAIEPEIEEKLGKSMPLSAGGEPAAEGGDQPVPNLEGFGQPSADQPAELKELRYRVHTLQHENNQLKNELKILKERLSQIKKLAA